MSTNVFVTRICGSRLTMKKILYEIRVTIVNVGHIVNHCMRG